ncbi:MAG: PTS sugar transporter subunit IIA, partial [Desulfuromusa sp.]|nr:PTS sugar transporter subunit IIA [Desulfuromusa sp.]
MLDLDQKSIVLGAQAASKLEAIELVGKVLTQNGYIDPGYVESMKGREAVANTFLGNGIAIPHGKLPNLDKLHGIFARLEHPIDFESIDDRPVDLIFLLLAP